MYNISFFFFFFFSGENGHFPYLHFHNGKKSLSVGLFLA